MQVCVQGADGHYRRAACRYPADAAMAILIPDHSMPTKEARKALPEQYSKADAVHNTGRAALFVAAMASGDMDLLAEATDDASTSAIAPPSSRPCSMSSPPRETPAPTPPAERRGQLDPAICPEAPRAISQPPCSKPPGPGLQRPLHVTRIAREAPRLQS